MTILFICSFTHTTHAATVITQLSFSIFFYIVSSITILINIHAILHSVSHVEATHSFREGFCSPLLPERGYRASISVFYIIRKCAHKSTAPSTMDSRDHVLLSPFSRGTWQEGAKTGENTRFSAIFYLYSGPVVLYCFCHCWSRISPGRGDHQQRLYERPRVRNMHHNIFSEVGVIFTHLKSFPQLEIHPRGLYE